MQLLWRPLLILAARSPGAPCAALWYEELRLLRKLQALRDAPAKCPSLWPPTGHRTMIWRSVSTIPWDLRLSESSGCCNRTLQAFHHCRWGMRQPRYSQQHSPYFFLCWGHCHLSPALKVIPPVVPPSLPYYHYFLVSWKPYFFPKYLHFNKCENFWLISGSISLMFSI